MTRAAPQPAPLQHLLGTSRERDGKTPQVVNISIPGPIRPGPIRPIRPMLLGAVAAVSLLVGGIGIMNIMLVSVTERTREIGIRLAIGALEREVLLQFLIEAVVLSSLGGVVGIALATGASIGLSKLMGIPYSFGLGINLLSFLFSAAIGVIFGFFPGAPCRWTQPDRRPASRVISAVFPLQQAPFPCHLRTSPDT